MDAGYAETANVKELYQVRLGKNMPWPNLTIDGKSMQDSIIEFFFIMGI